MSALFSAAFMLLAIPVIRKQASRVAVIEEQLMQRKDERLQIVSEALDGMKLIKLQSWEEVFRERITGAREKETSMLRKWLCRMAA